MNTFRIVCGCWSCLGNTGSSILPNLVAYARLFQEGGHQLSTTGALVIDRSNQNSNTQSYLSSRVCNWLTPKNKDHCSCTPEPAQTLLFEFIQNTSNPLFILLLCFDKYALLFYLFSKYFWFEPTIFIQNITIIQVLYLCIILHTFATSLIFAH